MSVAADQPLAPAADNRGLLANRIVSALAWAGVFVTSVLTYSHFWEKSLPCGMNRGCDAVTQSAYSMWGPVPVAVVGLVGYLALALLAAIRSSGSTARWKPLARVSLIGTTLGLLTSIYFMATSFGELKATCFWCVSSAVVMMFSWLFTWWLSQCPVPEAAKPGKDTFFHSAGLVLALGATAAVAIVMDKSVGDKKLSGPIGQILPGEAKMRGPVDAPITIVEFADFNCPTCRATAPVMDDIFKKANGKVRWAFRNMPLVKLKGHETSMMVATASELAAQKGRFWEFFDAAFNEQNTVRIRSLDGIRQLGIESGLKAADLTEALAVGSSAAGGVIHDMDLALELGIEGTPTFVILMKGTEPKAVTARRLPTAIKEEPYRSVLGKG